MTLTYKDRSLANMNQLADHTKAAALKWVNFLEKNNMDILIYETIRTEAQQREDIQKGVSQTMKSYHLVGQALDFVPIQNGKADWNGYDHPDVQKAVAEAKNLGFEWGGDWSHFVDKGHLQYVYKGYGTDTFGQQVTTPTQPQNTGIDIKQGSRGKDVERVQRAVGATPDGIFGPTTEAKVKAYQKHHGLTPDGIVGPKTWTVMF